MLAVFISPSCSSSTHLSAPTHRILIDTTPNCHSAMFPLTVLPVCQPSKYFLWHSHFQFTCYSLLSYLFVLFIPFLYHFMPLSRFLLYPLKRWIQFSIYPAGVTFPKRTNVVCVRERKLPHPENDKTCPLSKTTCTDIYSFCFRKWRRLLTSSSEILWCKGNNKELHYWYKRHTASQLPD